MIGSALEGAEANKEADANAAEHKSCSNIDQAIPVITEMTAEYEKALSGLYRILQINLKEEPYAVTPLGTLSHFIPQIGAVSSRHSLNCNV